MISNILNKHNLGDNGTSECVTYAFTSLIHPKF